MGTGTESYVKEMIAQEWPKEAIPWDLLKTSAVSWIYLSLQAMHMVTIKQDNNTQWRYITVKKMQLCFYSASPFCPLISLQIILCKTYAISQEDIFKLIKLYIAKNMTL